MLIQYTIALLRLTIHFLFCVFTVIKNAHWFSRDLLHFSPKGAPPPRSLPAPSRPLLALPLPLLAPLPLFAPPLSCLHYSRLHYLDLHCLSLQYSHLHCSSLHYSHLHCPCLHYSSSLQCSSFHILLLCIHFLYPYVSSSLNNNQSHMCCQRSSFYWFLNAR